MKESIASMYFLYAKEQEYLPVVIDDRAPDEGFFPGDESVGCPDASVIGRSAARKFRNSLPRFLYLKPVQTVNRRG
jgi:hypothetical protein